MKDMRGRNSSGSARKGFRSPLGDAAPAYGQSAPPGGGPEPPAQQPVGSGGGQKGDEESRWQGLRFWGGAALAVATFGLAAWGAYTGTRSWHDARKVVVRLAAVTHVLTGDD